MRTLGIIILSVLMGLGLYALYDATMQERAIKEAEAKHIERCRQVAMLILSEADAVLANGKFPSLEQQDYWMQLIHGCDEGKLN